MAQEIKSFNEHYAGFLRHIKLALATCVGVIMIGLVVSFSLPDIFRSTALIMIEEQDIPTSLVQTTVTVYATRQISALNNRIMTDSNLSNIIEKFDLYAKERESIPTRLLAKRARERMDIEFISADAPTPMGQVRSYVAAFSISFKDEEPEKAQQVASELVSLYMEANLEARTGATADTKQFIDDEVAALDRQVVELETQLATFKEDNAGSLPSLNMVNLQMMQRVDQQLLEIERRLFSIQENRIGIEAQLATVDRTQPRRLADGQMVLSPSDQLEALKTQLTLIEGRYSEDHPDVIKIRSDIAALQARFGFDVEPAQLQEQIVEARAKLAIAEESYSEEHPDVIRLRAALKDLEEIRKRYDDTENDSDVDADNPAYIQLESQLNALEVDERALASERNKLRAKLDDYEARMLRTPQVEREMAGLARELSSVSNRYWVLRDKQFGAQMGQNLELQSKGERFSLVEPAAVPLEPFAPDRLAIIVLSILLGLIFGVAVTQVADALDDAIYNADAIIGIQGTPPIIEVPIIIANGGGEGARLISLKMIVLGAIPVVFIVLLLLVHLLIKPLDVIFFSVSRAIGF